MRCLRSQLIVFKAEEGKWDEERPKKRICYKNSHTLRRFFFILVLSNELSLLTVVGSAPP